MPRSAKRAPYRRPVYETVLARAHEPRRFIQVLAGPRQVGKTTLARQVMDAVGVPAHFASADDPALCEHGWLETQWEIGRLRARNGGRAGGLLVMDEIQKIPAWSESVKRLWDEDTADGLELRVMLLGSAPLLVQKGLTESLAGRFELIRVSHWSFPEMRDAFGWTLDQYLYFGGYPGAADLIGDEDRWSRYLLDSLVETTLARDVLLLTRVDKPALLRQLFRLGCEHSADVVPYSRMLGRLTDAGNTTTLAHYIGLLAGSGMLTGLPKYDGTDAAARRPRQRASSPKLLALNTALMTAGSGRSFEAARADAQFWGRLVETAVGAHLANGPAPGRVGYWRQGSREVDFVVAPPVDGGRPLAIEVASGRGRDAQPGMAAFERAHPGARRLQIGGRGMGLEEFLSESAASWVA
jgi:predicted AAA+ superfamily ATPase